LKAEAQPEVIAAEPAVAARATDFLALTKPRIAALALLATFAGYYLARPAGVSLWNAVPVLIGAALVAAGAGGLNQLLERDADRLMLRTRHRPLPAGRLRPGEALVFSGGLALGGLVWLGITTPPLTASLAAVTIGTYLGLYTPLKRRTPLNTFVGAVPGALPPLIGWSAAAGALSTPAWSLFLILFLWQLPHFWAIAWLYRADYARGGMKMLSVVSPGGERLARQIIGQTLALLAVSLLPVRLALTGPLYGAAALILGIGFLACGISLARRRTEASARRLLLASVIYLPVLLTVLMLDKT